MFEWATRHPLLWLSRYTIEPGRALSEAIYMPISREGSRSDKLLEGITIEAIKLIPSGFTTYKLAIKAGEYFS